MNFKSIKALITYWEEHYGKPYRFRIEEMGKKSEVFYYWETVPEDLLTFSVKRFWSTTYRDQYGLTHEELEIIY